MGAREWMGYESEMRGCGALRIRPSGFFSLAKDRAPRPRHLQVLACGRVRMR
jgi:hypothetical protein